MQDSEQPTPHQQQQLAHTTTSSAKDKIQKPSTHEENEAATKPREKVVWCKTVGRYEIGKTIGVGEFGKYVTVLSMYYDSHTQRVKSAKNKETSEKVALKILNKRDLAEKGLTENVKKEVMHFSRSSYGDF